MRLSYCSLYSYEYIYDNHRKSPSLLEKGSRTIRHFISNLANDREAFKNYYSNYSIALVCPRDVFISTNSVRTIHFGVECELVAVPR